MKVQLTTTKFANVANFQDASDAVIKFIGKKRARFCPAGWRIFDGDNVIAYVVFNGNVHEGDIKGFWEGMPSKVVFERKW